MTAFDNIFEVTLLPLHVGKASECLSSMPIALFEWVTFSLLHMGPTLFLHITNHLPTKSPLEPVTGPITILATSFTSKWNPRHLIPVAMAGWKNSIGESYIITWCHLNNGETPTTPFLCGIIKAQRTLFSPNSKPNLLPPPNILQCEMASPSIKVP